MADETIMLTTKDNPWSPFTNFNEWYAFDMSHGYNSCGKLARMAKTSSVLPDSINERLIRDAIYNIIRLDATGTWIATTK